MDKSGKRDQRFICHLKRTDNICNMIGSQAAGTATAAAVNVPHKSIIVCE